MRWGQILVYSSEAHLPVDQVVDIHNPFVTANDSLYPCDQMARESDIARGLN